MATTEYYLSELKSKKSSLGASHQINVIKVNIVEINQELISQQEEGKTM